MDLKFSFGGASPDHHDHAGAPSGIPLPFAGAATRPSSASASSVLEVHVRIGADADAAEVIAEALSGDGVSYGRASKAIASREPEGVAAATRSVLARVGAELGDPLVGSVSAVVLTLAELALPVLAELGLRDGQRSVNAALQARTGVPIGTEIRIA